MNKSKSRALETVCFAIVFFFAHLLVSIFFERSPFLDATDGAGQPVAVLEQFFRSAIAVVVATPIYMVLLSWYGKLRAKRGGASGRPKQ